MNIRLVFFLLCLAVSFSGCNKNGLEGDVRIFKTETSVPGIKIQATTSTDIKEEQAKATRFGSTDQTGRYIIRGLLPNRKYRITSADPRYISEPVLEVAPEKGTRIISTPLIVCPIPEANGIWFYDTENTGFKQIDGADAPRLRPRIHAGLLPGMWSRNAAYSISENDALKVSASIPDHGLIIIRGKVSESIAPLYKVRQLNTRNRHIEAGWYFNVSDFRVDNWGDLVPVVHELKLGLTFNKDDLVAIPADNLAHGLYFFTTRFAIIQRSALQGNLNQPQEGYLIKVGDAQTDPSSDAGTKDTSEEPLSTSKSQPVESGAIPIQNDNFARIDKQSQAYILATKLSATIPALSPEMNIILVEAEGLRISTFKVISSISNSLGSRASQLTNMDATQLKQTIMNEATRLGERTLLINAAQAANLSVTDEEVEQVLRKEYAQSGGEDNFINSLRSQGTSIDYIRRGIWETLLINKYLGQISKAPVISDGSSPQTATVRHILLLTQGKTEAEKREIRKRIEGILARAKSGEDFSSLARQYSEDPGSKDNGGLYENFKRGMMVKPFEQAAFSVPAGEISGIVETAFGYHIIKVIERTVGTQASNESATNEPGTNAIQDPIKELKDKAGFRIYPMRLDS